MSRRPAGGSATRITLRRWARCPEVRRDQVLRTVAAAAGDRAIRSIGVVLVSDRRISELHHRYMNDPEPTDVLTFDLRADGDDAALDGEIVVSMDTARRAAKSLGVRVETEVLRYVAHGVLHLLGYDDHDRSGRSMMRRLENRVLSEIGLVCGSGVRSTGGRGRGRPRA